jgi:hypothetical protein
MPLRYSKIFIQALEKSCKESLTQNIISALANILSMDFHLRGDNQDINTYPEICAQKVSKYLENADFENASLDDVLTLFAAAINNNSSDKDTDDQAIEQMLAKDRAMLEDIFTSLPGLASLSAEEKKIAIDELLKLKKIDKQINFQILAQHRNILSQHVAHTLSQDQQKREEITEEILRLVKDSKKLEKTSLGRYINY